ncbi:helix-turn-helix domain-containing protein [Halomicrobium urmianum]|uniref:helix-turn-helix domain-containing protein n=1 Tax=Halomicrobium urmianum TaxID=1586233 RepID=UPI001CD996A8|nr:helix-turn-helix domain-containing protein [Halomicrobium urmianum]
MSTTALRSATLSLSGAIHSSVFDQFDRSSAVSIVATRYLGPVENEQYVGLADLRGDLDVARDLLAESDRVLRYDVAGTDERGIVYAHYRSAGPVGELLTILYDNDVVLDWPIEHRQMGPETESRITIVGTDEGIQQAIADIPDVSELSLLRIGQVRAGNDASPLLTETQAALLDLAIEAGYYEVPRETTQSALADRLGITPGTVSDRLQRIERRVMTAYAQRPPDGSAR